MTNVHRHQRRAAVADFRRRAAGTYLTTFLVPTSVSLDGHVSLQQAAAFWEANRAVRKPVCICCKQVFADDQRVGGFLFATMPNPSPDVSISAVCVPCWRGAPSDELERKCIGVLRQLLPGGRLEPLGDVS